MMIYDVIDIYYKIRYPLIYQCKRIYLMIWYNIMTPWKKNHHPKEI